MSSALRIAVPVFLAAQAGLVHWAAGGEHPPPIPNFSSFPAQFGDWKQVREDPVADDVAKELGADQTLSRTYAASSGSVASLFVAWFQSQRGGSRQPHSPKVCLPAAGFTPESTGEIVLDTPSGPITINRYLVSQGRSKAVVLYWYQTPRRVVAGEWAAKFWLVSDAFRDKRTDTALVRVVTWVANNNVDAATDSAASFARSMYPLLRDQLPR